MKLCVLFQVRSSTSTALASRSYYVLHSIQILYGWSGGPIFNYNRESVSHRRAIYPASQLSHLDSLPRELIVSHIRTLLGISADKL